MKLLVAVLLLAVLLFVAYMVAFHTIPPSTRVTIEREPGGYRFDFAPNFVVNSVYRVEIFDPTGALLYETPASPSQQPGRVQVSLATDLKPGQEVKVRYRMQYDRFVACATEQEEWIALP